MRLRLHYLVIASSIPLYLFVFGHTSAAQEKNNGPSPNDQEQLIRAQRKSADAQAEYYETLTGKARQAEVNSHKSLRDSIVENPVSISAIVAAFLATLVGLLNLRSSAKARRDTQFYEALKRYGDKDSATSRASAAGLLGQMGKVRSNWPNFRKARPFIIAKRPYLDTALDQLVSGLLLEVNSVVITSTENAIRQLIPFAPNNAALRLHEVNLRLQEELTDALAEYFVRRGLEAIPPTSLDDRQHWHLWEQLGSLVSFHHSTLRDFVARSEKLSKYLDEYLQVRNSSDTTGERLALAQNRIRNISRRLESNQKVLSEALRQAEWKGHQWFSGSFLVSADLSKANLSHLDFLGSFMIAAWFDGSNLSNCSFIDTDLRGASFWHCTLKDAWLTRANIDLAGFKEADLTNSKLADVKLRSVEKLGSTKWWKADFYLAVDQNRVDTQLLDQLFQTFSESGPKDPSEMHPSVRQYRAEQLSSTKEAEKTGSLVTNSPE